MVNRRRSLAERPSDRVAVEQDSAWIAAVRARLGDWYADAGRELPWRASRDAYRILVSEMMLVQTTVVAVIPFFERFHGPFSRRGRPGRGRRSRGGQGLGGTGLLPQGQTASSGGARQSSASTPA